MIYICDFFAAKEAVSNQMEMLRSANNSLIFSASRFLNQKKLRIADLKNKRIIISERFYEIFLPLVVGANKNGIHYFEEEPSEKKRLVFNRSKSDLFISMYKKPDQGYVKHLKRYKNLKKVFVELESHKQILIENGISEHKVEVFKTPSLFYPQQNNKRYDPKRVNLLFASWNNAEGNPLEERGVNYLLDLIANNSNLTLTVMPRDNLIKEFLEKVKGMNLEKRVRIKWPRNQQELKKVFEECDLVAFASKIKISKDVPNSIVDGLSLGKPCVVSRVVDFSKTVEDRRLGLVLNDFNVFDFNVSQTDYRAMSDRAYKYSFSHSKNNYLEIINNYK
jgi:glycosyltransferase involved in cell wall biosynthesis